MNTFGITLTPDQPQKTLLRLASEIEDAGFDAIYTPEVNNDSLTQSYALAVQTNHIKLGTWVTNIYFRTAAICATSAAMIQDVSEGRFTLGLGISHKPILESLGLEQGPNPRGTMIAYVDDIRKTWSGEINIFGSTFPSPSVPVPIHLGAMLISSVSYAAEIAEGALLLCCTVERYKKAQTAALEAGNKAGKQGAFDVKLGIPTFIEDKLEDAYAKARRSALIYMGIPNYIRMFIASGFEAEAAAVQDALKRGNREEAEMAISNKMLDSVCLIGPSSRCLEQLEKFHKAGVENTIMVPGPQAGNTDIWVRKVIDTFGNLN